MAGAAFAYQDCLARPKILLLGALFGALHGCATKAPPKTGALNRDASSNSSVRLAVMRADSLLIADVATALDEQLGHARVAGARTAIRANVSMEVAQLALECVSPTDECYSQVGRFLQVDRLLWRRISRATPPARASRSPWCCSTSPAACSSGAPRKSFPRTTSRSVDCAGWSIARRRHRPRLPSEPLSQRERTR